jgi:hypothetical protein
MNIQEKTIDPNYVSGCPFHGDTYLMNIIDDIINKQNISQFVETGTGYADTLYYMGCNYNIPSISCEVDTVRFEKCTKFTSEQSNIKIYNMDSPSLISSNNIDKNVKKLFWLDAHGCFTNSNNEIITIDPIRQELSAIFNNFKNPEILIDDFKNPFFPKNIYAYDIYSEFKKHGIFSSKMGKRLREKIMERGGHIPGIQLLRDFLGREESFSPFLKTL